MYEVNLPCRHLRLAHRLSLTLDKAEKKEEKKADTTADKARK